MKNKGLQKFTKEYLEECKKMSPADILEFLENFRLLQEAKKPSKTRLISLKVPEDLLFNFRHACKRAGVKYQTQIKVLMEAYLNAK